MATYPESVAVILPCYNEAETIESVLTDLKRVLAKYPQVRWEIMVVDDGSTDNSAERVRAVEGVRLIRHPMNRGYGASIKRGIRAAKSEIVATMDADGQHNPEDLIRLVEDMEDYQMSVGCRVASSGVPTIRRPGKCVLKWVLEHFVQEGVPDINSGMRVMRRDIIMRYLHLCSNKFSFSMSSTISLLSEGFFVRYVPIHSLVRQGSVSRVNVLTGLTTLLLILRLVMVFHPLRIFLPLTLLAGSFTFSVLLWDLINYNKVTQSTNVLIFSTCFLGFFGLLSDQLAHLRRELHSF